MTPEPTSGDQPRPEENAPDPTAKRGDDAQSDPPAREKMGAWVKEFALYPFFIVLGIVGVFTLFSHLLRNDETALDYLQQLRTSGGNDRWYAAFQLSNHLARDEENLRGDPVFLAEAERAFEAGANDDPRVQRYLAIVLGRIGTAENLPTLEKALAGDDDVETRMWSAWAMGSIADQAAVPALIAALEDADPAVRKTSAYALGSLRDPRSVEPLTLSLQDEVEDVRWNAAIGLALLGDGAGFAVLKEMVNSLHLSRIDGMTDESVKSVMLNAVKALGVLQETYPSARDLLEETKESAPFPVVRQEAEKQLAAGESGARS
jgi:HEAT repeat protein